MSTSEAFRRAVKTGVPRADRRAAIDRLAEMGEVGTLRLFVQVAGMDGRLRRRALEALRRASATRQLDRIADDRSLDPVLRERAEDLE